MPTYSDRLSEWYTPAQLRRLGISDKPKEEFEFGKEPGSVPYAKLAQMVNQFMTQQAAAPFIANLPDYQNLVAQRSQNIGGQLRGEVPQDVRNVLGQSAAERGIATGQGGGPNVNAAWLRALGLTSIGQQQLGQQGLTQAIADTPIPEIWNPMSLYVPERLAQQELQAARTPIQLGPGRTFTPNQNYGQNVANAAWQDALKFSASNASKQAAQSAQLKAANDAAWAVTRARQSQPSGTGSATLTQTSPVGGIFGGGFPQFGGMGLY